MLDGRLLVGDLRVQEIVRGNGRVSHTVVDTDCTLVAEADGFLRACRAGTDRTYAHALVDHLRWLRFAGLDTGSVSLEDLRHYMAALGADYPGPFGLPWRKGKRPYGHSALKTAAACLKGFYLRLGTHGVNPVLAEALRVTRLPTRADRRRAMLGHVLHSMPRESSCSGGAAAPASEDAAGRCPGGVAGGGVERAGPDGGHVAGRRRFPDR